ncbi:hypothetical protein [Bradyrhizobium jicamae]|uniref:hypothetical protein n=1 Tax=Bradyrhizobium jicamae TaxID=280332 RepID=UPI001BAABF2F|nr:hypothetical protein [Bradyrhizobium jicamae]MBR0934851.1 hypothetical protein [Bradyrhizobium jicamae]
MPKTAVDPFFSTNAEPVTAGRHSMVVSASAADLPHVTSSLIVNCGATAGSITVLMPDDLDTNGVVVPIAANSTTQLQLQVRAVTAIGTGIGVCAMWSA